MQKIATTFHNTTQTIAYRWQYEVIKQTMVHPDIGIYNTYGLQLYQCQNSQCQLIASVNDISTDRQLVEQLASRFTLHQLSPQHFRDAVIDALP